MTKAECLYRIEIIALAFGESYASAKCDSTGFGELTVSGCSDAVIRELRRTLPLGTRVLKAECDT